MVQQEIIYDKQIQKSMVINGTEQTNFLVFELYNKEKLQLVKVTADSNGFSVGIHSVDLGKVILGLEYLYKNQTLAELSVDEGNLEYVVNGYSFQARILAKPVILIGRGIKQLTDFPEIGSHEKILSEQSDPNRVNNLFAILYESGRHAGQKDGFLSGVYAGMAGLTMAIATYIIAGRIYKKFYGEKK
jgi:hypothetical protein